MSNIDIIRAWKDEDYRNSLSEEQRSHLPENPAGMVELSDAEMEAITGGMNKAIVAGKLQLQHQTCTVGGEICCSSGDLPPCGSFVISSRQAS
jgi:mersacidin/lichenicidin family type 2 lantibiotic